jgi:hypothetical protein
VLEELVPQAHEPALSYGCERLDPGQVLWALVEIHAPEADSDGARRHQNDFVPVMLKLYSSLDDDAQDGKKWFMRLLVDDGTGSWE